MSVYRTIGPLVFNNSMAFVNILFFSDFLHFDKSLLLLTVTLRGVSNKHCLLSLFSLYTANRQMEFINLYLFSFLTNFCIQNGIRK